MDEASVERLDEGWLLRFRSGSLYEATSRRAASPTFAESLSRIADHFGYRIESLDLKPYRLGLAEYARSGDPLDDAAEHAAMNAVPDLTPEQVALMEAASPPEPIDVLNVEKASEPCAYGDGS